MIKCKNIDRICQAQSLNMFKNIRKNMDKLLYSSYITEIVTNFGIEDDPSSKEIYELLYKGLSRIDKAEDRREILIAVIKFQLKMMLIEGFHSNLTPVFAAAIRFLQKTCSYHYRWEVLFVRNATNL